MKRKPIKKSMKITIAGFILVLAAVIFSAGYVNANSRIKPPEEIYFDGKSGTETEKNLFFKVEDFYFLGDKEIRNMPELPDSTIYPMEMKVICLNRSDKICIGK